MSKGRPSPSAAPEPPRAAVMLIERCMPGRAGAALLGDLEEEFHTYSVPQWGAAKARRWYWTQVLRSFWPALTFHVHRGSAGRLVAAVALGVTTLFVLGDIAMAATVASFGAVWPIDPAPGPLIEAVYLLGLLPASILGGYATAWHGKRNGIVAALALAAVTVLPIVATIFSESRTPTAWHAVWFLVSPVGIVWGAMRYVRRHPVG